MGQRLQATCHPELKATAFGLCQTCYQHKWYLENKDKVAERSRKWRQNNKERYFKNNRRFWLKSNYGMTEEDYNTMLETQNGRCKICGATMGTRTNRLLCVDHNHKTGQVRALLCNACNAVIGHANERIDILQKCIDYLNEYK